MPRATQQDRRPGSDAPPHTHGRSALRKARYGYLWVTLGLFLASIAGHWGLAWQA